MHRLRLQFGDEKAEKMKSRAERERKHAAHMEKLEKEAAMDPNLVPVGERPSAARGASAARPIAPLDEIPEVEWLHPNSGHIGGGEVLMLWERNLRM